MRMRKSARSHDLPLFPSLHPDDHNLCTLNQSPWDVIASSPSDSSFSGLYQVLGEVQSNGGSGRSAENLVNCEDNGDANVREHPDRICEKEKQAGSDGALEGHGRVEFFCLELDQDGWQCGASLKQGQAKCEIHDQLQKNSRPRQADMYEYYAGFGPSWSRRRSARVSSRLAINAATTSGNVSELGTLGDGHADVGKEGKRVQVASKRPSADLDQEMENPNVNGNKEEQKAEASTSKKRARKKQKSRSLDSLM